jgi:aminopeptidase N
LWKFPDGEGYGGIVYSGGALFFLDLEAAMGKEKLVSALRRYLAERRWEIATGADLVRILMEASGGEIEGVIETWRRGGRP